MPEAPLWNKRKDRPECAPRVPVLKVLAHVGVMDWAVCPFWKLRLMLTCHENTLSSVQVNSAP